MNAHTWGKVLSCGGLQEKSHQKEVLLNLLFTFSVKISAHKQLTAMKTSFSVGIPTGRQPFVARLRLIFFCLLLPKLGNGDACFAGSRVRPMDREPLEALVFGGHSLASFNLACGWSRPDREVSRWDLVWVEVGALDRGQLEMGMVGGNQEGGAVITLRGGVSLWKSKGWKQHLAKEQNNTIVYKYSRVHAAAVLHRPKRTLNKQLHGSPGNRLYFIFLVCQT